MRAAQLVYLFKLSRVKFLRRVRKAYKALYSRTESLSQNQLIFLIIGIGILFLIFGVVLGFLLNPYRPIPTPQAQQNTNQTTQTTTETRIGYVRPLNDPSYQSEATHYLQEDGVAQDSYLLLRSDTISLVIFEDQIVRLEGTVILSKDGKREIMIVEKVPFK